MHKLHNQKSDNSSDDRVNDAKNHKIHVVRANVVVPLRGEVLIELEFAEIKDKGEHLSRVHTVNFRVKHKRNKGCVYISCD